MGQAAQPAPTGNAVHYERRRLEERVLYRLVQEQLETFLAQVEAETGASLPKFIKEEFDAFLECGISAHSFLRLRCAEYAHAPARTSWARLLKRVFDIDFEHCPNCGARIKIQSPPLKSRRWLCASSPIWVCPPGRRRAHRRIESIYSKRLEPS